MNDEAFLNYIYAESIGIITGKIKEKAEFGREIKYEQCEITNY